MIYAIVALGVLSVILFALLVRSTQSSSSERARANELTQRLEIGLLEREKIVQELELAREQERHVREAEIELRVRIQETEKRLVEERDLLKSAETRLQETFTSLASESLSKNSEAFLRLAGERLDKKTMEAKGAFDEKVQHFQHLLEPMKLTLAKVEQNLVRNEQSRSEQFGAIAQQLLAVQQSSEVLRKEAGALSSALRRPEVRGSWGEIQLRRVVELAGMSPYCDFDEQVSTHREDRILRPDMIVHLPNKRNLVVDSKAVLDSFLTAIEADTLEKKQEALIQHARNLRTRVADLAKKSYWEQFQPSPDFAVLFIPNEAILSAAVDIDRALIEDALIDRIVIATPSTLVALLKAVAYGWQQEKVSENAQEIIKVAREFQERLNPWLKHLSDVGNKLNTAVKSYNDAMSSLDRRVLPTSRKLQDLGVKADSDTAEIKALELTARGPDLPEILE